MKISLIGCGNVGATFASLAISKELCDELYLFDIFEDFLSAKQMDLAQMAILLNSKTQVFSSSSYKDLNGSDIVVLSAGKPRKDGMSRQDLLLINAKTIYDISKQIANFAPNCIIIVVSNPLDEMLYVAYKASNFPKNRLLGMAGELDSSRLIYNISKFYPKQKDIRAKVVGPHNNDMIISKSLINIDIKEHFEEICILTKNAGANITKLAKASAFYAPAAGIFKMIKAIKEENNEIISCCIINEDNLPFGTLVILDKNGIKEIVDNEIDTNSNILEKIFINLKENISILDANIIE